jgi:AcrR family transcriptional regulator
MRIGMTSSEPKVSTATPGRPRDERIDVAVLQATVDLLESVGYLQLSVAAIAQRAGTTKPAIYRRWPTKAHLVHDAVFPASEFDDIQAGEDLRTDLRSLVVAGIELLGRPAARAAVPGLLAETAADPELGARVFLSVAGGTWAWLEQRLHEAVEAGEVRPAVKAATVFSLLAGGAFIAAVSRPAGVVEEESINEIVDVIMRGIAP